MANVILDYVFIVEMGMGISGAAIATGIGYSIPSIFGVIYFFVKRKGVLKFVKFKMDVKVLTESSFNGMSEMVTNLATAVTTILFNIVMLRLIGEDGVAAITIVLYSQFLLTAIYLGFSSGIAPVFSYNYGAEDRVSIKKLFRYSMIFNLVSSILITGLALVLAPIIVGLFAEKGTDVYNIGLHGFTIFSVGYLFTGTNIFASSMFTAFSNGKVSALISFFRTFVFIALFVITLPYIIGVNGVWIAVPMAELLTLLISFFFIFKLKHVYHYA